MLKTEYAAGGDAAPLRLPLESRLLAGDPEPLIATARGWRHWFGPAVSVAVILAVGTQVDDLDLHRVWALLPPTPLFWLLFAAWYLVPPLSEWAIFHRLWHIPAGAGLVALLRKLVSNEILLGYLGEVYFYSWARERSDLPGAPFGAVKDVAILSALAGNLVTLAMLAFAWPLLGALHLGLHGHALLLSVGTVVLSSAAAMLFRRRLFSLPRPELRFVLWLHLARIAATTLLAACLWHLVLPSVALSWWLLLATLRLLVSRLPFVPNKDLVFAGLAIFLIGRDAQISDLMAMMATIILATHLALGASLAARDVARWCTGQTA